MIPPGRSKGEYRSDFEAILSHPPAFAASFQVNHTQSL